VKQGLKLKIHHQFESKAKSNPFGFLWVAYEFQYLKRLFDLS
jgi:hypothetical protein